MLTAEQSKRLILNAFLVSLVMGVVYPVGTYVLIGLGGFEAISFLSTLSNLISQICTLAIALAFFSLNQQTRQADDLVVAIGFALSLLTGFVVNTSVVSALIIGLISYAGTLALAWRIRSSQRLIALLLACCTGIVLVARTVFFGLIIENSAASTALVNQLWSLGAFAVAVLSYLAVRKEFSSSAAAPIANTAIRAMNQSVRRPAEAAQPAQPAPAKPTFNGAVSSSSKTKGGASAQTLVAEPEQSFEEVRSTNGLNVWLSLMNDTNETLLIQNNHSMLMSSSFGRPLLRSMAADEKYRELAEAMESTARITAGLITKPCDVTIAGKPYDAWLLEHFERRNHYDDSKVVDTITWDYCLARDGGLFVVTQTSDGDVRINDMLPFYPAMVADSNNMGLVLVMHGCVAALDLVPADRSARKTYRFRGNDETLEFDFPWDDEQDQPFYNSTLGLTQRFNLLVGQDIWADNV